MSTGTEVPIACTPDAIPADRRDRWMEVGKQVYSKVVELKELADGYAYRLPSDAPTLILSAEYVSMDRLCCAFLRWSRLSSQRAAHCGCI